MRRGTRGYDPEEAHVRARARMWSGSRLDRDDDLRERVLAMLMRSWSPEQVSGHLKREAGKPVISYESIYRFVYSQITRENNFGWRQYLPRRKAKRGWRGRKGGSSTVTIAKRRPLAERPAEAADRQTPGHWEADLMLFRRHSQAVLALHERHTRLLIAVRLPGKGADHIASVMTQVLSAFPPAMRRSVTFDNGTEFARRHRLHDLGVQTFFCDTYSPWQKGGVENAIGRMRLFPHAQDRSGHAGRPPVRSVGADVTIRRANAWATEPRLPYSQRSSIIRCCTSNVNSASRLRRNDGC